MIPSVLAHQVQQGVKDFLKTTFPLSTPISMGFSKIFSRGKEDFSGDPTFPSTFHSGGGKGGRISSPMSR
jgi:DEAD/DEAH box helicase domain-containing protein